MCSKAVTASSSTSPKPASNYQPPRYIRVALQVIALSACVYAAYSYRMTQNLTKALSWTALSIASFIFSQFFRSNYVPKLKPYESRESAEKMITNFSAQAIIEGLKTPDPGLDQSVAWAYWQEIIQPIALAELQSLFGRLLDLKITDSLVSSGYTQSNTKAQLSYSVQYTETRGQTKTRSVLCNVQIDANGKATLDFQSEESSNKPENLLPRIPNKEELIVKFFKIINMKIPSSTHIVTLINDKWENTLTPLGIKITYTGSKETGFEFTVTNKNQEIIGRFSARINGSEYHIIHS